MSLEITLYVIAIYCLAGCVKGVVGLGLPTISIALVATVLGLREAMVLLIIPSLVTNLFRQWLVQALVPFCKEYGCS